MDKRGGVWRWAVAALGIACAQGWLTMVSAATAAYARLGDVGFVLGPLWPGFALGALLTLGAVVLACEGMRVGAGEKSPGAGPDAEKDAAARRAVARVACVAAHRLRSLRVPDLAALVAGLLGAMLMIVSHSMADLFGGAPVAPVAVLAFVGCLLMGAGSAVLCVAWWGRLVAAVCGGGEGEGADLSLGPVVATSLTAAATVCLLAGLFSLMGHTVWAPLLNAALMLCSFACLRLVGAGGKEGRGSLPAPVAGLPVRARAGSLVLGLAVSVMLGQFVGARFARALPETWAFGLLGVALVAAVLLAVRRAVGRWNPQAANWAVAAGLVVAFYPIDAGTDFSLKFAMAGTACALGMALAALPASAASAGMSLAAGVTGGERPDKAARVARCWVESALFLGAGAAVGAPLGYWIAGTPAQGTFVLVSAIAAMVAGFVALVLLMRPGEEGRRERGAQSGGLVGDALQQGARVDNGDAAGSTDHRCAQLAAQCGLTPREAQVLLVLARGYDVARVQEELGVSEGTALTHKRHIYQKLGVHTRSELLDLVRDPGAAH